MIVCVS